MSSSINRISLAISCLIAVVSAGACAQSVHCTALIGFQEDLWLAQPDGTLLSRISNDAKLKPAAALHPSAALVAYSTLDSTPALILADASGRILDRLDLGASEPIISLAWVSPNLLRAGEHRGPSYSQFHLFALAPGNRLSRVASVEATGSECAISPKRGEWACINADAVTLGANDLYYATDTIQTGAQLQTLTLALGTSSPIDTVPPMHVEFRDQTAATVTLRIVAADGQSSEKRISIGKSMTFQASDDEGVIGLEPVRTGDPATIKLIVTKSSTGPARFEGNIAWDPSAKRIAVVESNGTPQRTAILLHTQAGQAAIKGHGAIDRRFKLPIEGPIVSVRFNSDTSIRFEGLAQAVEYNIPAHGKAPAQSPYSIKPVPPIPDVIDATFSGRPAKADVRGWACR